MAAGLADQNPSILLDQLDGISYLERHGAFLPCHDNASQAVRVSLLDSPGRRFEYWGYSQIGIEADQSPIARSLHENHSRRRGQHERIPRRAGANTPRD